MRQGDNDPRQPGHGQRLEEGAGWNKPVSPPKAETRPAGLPPKPAPPPAQTSNEEED